LDKDFNKIIKRLKYSFKEKAKYKKVTQELLAKELGFKASTFSQRKRDNSIPYEEILDLCYKYGINPQWVLFGITSEFLLTQSGDVEVSYAKHVAEQKALGINEFILPTNPSIDYLNLLFKSEYYDYIDKDKAKLFTMRDDSMEKLISPKDKVLIDISNKELVENNLYLISTPNGNTIRRYTIEDENPLFICENQSYTNTPIFINECGVIGSVETIIAINENYNLIVSELFNYNFEKKVEIVFKNLCNELELSEEKTNKIINLMIYESGNPGYKKALESILENPKLLNSMKQDLKRLKD
jgi:transcriptional regulator with XRE-family HTH domain